MAKLASIRVALADALSAIKGVQTSAYYLSAPTPPSFFVQPDGVAFDTAGKRGLDSWTFKLTGLVSVNTDIGAQKTLDGWLDSHGPTSVKAALEADTTLGGVVESLHVADASEYKQYQREGGGVALGAEWTVTVYARGDA